MVDKFAMQLSIRKMPKDPNMFEFSIVTPGLKTQFRLPRRVANDLRILIEKALRGK